MKVLGWHQQLAKQQLSATLPLNLADRQAALLEYLPQVRQIARRIHNHLPAQVPLDDLVDAGVIGLMDAVENVDLSDGEQIKFYVMFRVRAAILDKVRKMDWSPRHLRRQARYLREAREELRLHTRIRASRRNRHSDRQ